MDEAKIELKAKTWISIVRFEDGTVKMETSPGPPWTEVVDLFGFGVRILAETMAKENPVDPVPKSV